MYKLTWSKNFPLHSTVLVILHREPVLQQEEEHVVCLQVPNHHMLNVPGRVQTYNYIYDIQTTYSIKWEPGFDRLLYEKAVDGFLFWD